ncbi:MAG: ABC transporter permease subunit [Actinomycetota bacterium]|jgi:spermidine/putrescine transport system permease protein|nr:ABC transporter permease subunit [Actinomycetota bacterium]
MATTATTRPIPAATAGSPKRGARRRWTTYVLPLYAGLVIVYLLIPIAIMILYSFNDSRSHLPVVTFNWQGFTTQWYQTWKQVPELTPAFFFSLRLAAASTAVSAVVGTLLALALVRYRFRGQGFTEQVMFMNIAAPEIVLGASALGFFLTLNIPRGFITLFIAHVAFSIAYVTITVRARLAGFDRMIEQAAQDLGATPWVTFRKITLPLIFPAVMAGALLAFALSIDDFVTSLFVSGTAVTFPLWVYGAVKVGIPPQVFVMGTFIFTFGAVLALTSLALGTRKQRRAARFAATAAA